MNACRKSSVVHWALGALLLPVALLFSLPAYASPPPSKAEASERVEKMPRAMEALFEALQELPGIEARFQEEKHLSLLALPIESEGVLYFHKKGYLLRKITKPTPSSIRITPKELSIDEDGKRQRIELSSHRDVAHMVQSFLWILAGDIEALRTHFRMEFTSKDDTARNAVPAEWTLTLHPTHPRVKKLLERIRVQGNDVHVRRIVVEEQGGDRTVTTIQKADTARRFSDKEAKELFGKAP